ncbi:MAG: hypothetical protein HZB36_01905 [Candidatus Omnitrophica bacterium]|nr:hypothetical protein [Candidatus Omnitrophota bacterium]
MFKKMLYGMAGLVVGFVVASTFFPLESMAQYGLGGSGGFSEEVMTPEIPAKYGRLVAISGIDMYFQSDDGSVYIVKPRTQSEFNTRVSVVRRGQ